MLKLLSNLCGGVDGDACVRIGNGLTKPAGLRLKTAVKAAEGRILCSRTSLEKPSGALKRYCMAELAW